MAKVLVEDREENARVPFLRGILIRSLQDSGLSFDAAYELATEIRNDLSDTSVVTTSDLRQRVIEQLKTRSEDAVIDTASRKVPLASR
jgi:2-phosphoglycerate kinase